MGKRKRKRHGYVRRKTTSEAIHVVSICDEAIDRDDPGTDIEAFKLDRSSTAHLVFYEEEDGSEAVPMRFVVRALNSERWERVNIQGVSNGEDSAGNLSQRGAGVAMMFAAFDAAVSEVLNVPGENSAGEYELGTISGNEAKTRLPNDFVLDIGRYVIALSRPGEVREFGEDVGK